MAPEPDRAQVAAAAKVVNGRGPQSELEDTLERYLGDDSFAWELEPDGTWRRRQGDQRGGQAELMERAAQRQAEAAARASETSASAR